MHHLKQSESMTDANLISNTAQVRLTKLNIEGHFWLISLLL